MLSGILLGHYRRPRLIADSLGNSVTESNTQAHQQQKGKVMRSKEIAAIAVAATLVSYSSAFAGGLGLGGGGGASLNGSVGAQGTGTTSLGNTGVTSGISSSTQGQAMTSVNASTSQNQNQTQVSNTTTVNHRHQAQVKGNKRSQTKPGRKSTNASRGTSRTGDNGSGGQSQAQTGAGMTDQSHSNAQGTQP
jgi:hypothetical protein